jgi:hypothetical protein
VVTGVSLAAALAHTLLYARPRWQELVAAPLAASGLTAADVIRSHALYGVITAAHQFMQLRLLASHGALVLGLVNAVRASAVSVLSSALFCATAQQQCLTPWRAISAGVVSLGAAQWVLAGACVWVWRGVVWWLAGRSWQPSCGLVMTASLSITRLQASQSRAERLLVVLLLVVAPAPRSTTEAGCAGALRNRTWCVGQMQLSV